MAKKKLVKRGKWWFRGLKTLMQCRYKAPEFVYLEGKPFEDGSLILSNHEGTDAPMSLEMYLDKPVRMWGAHEMNSGLIKMYKYQTRVYYHEKKHWNLHLARLFCLIASPLTNLFYKGLNLISTYKDVRFFSTIKESCKAIQNKENIVVYPEDSSKGYLATLEGFYAGFMVFAESCYKKSLDIPIVVSYFRKKQKVFVFDKPIKYSHLMQKCQTKEKAIEYLLNRCNEIGAMDLSEFLPKQDDQEKSA
ncbi:MAG: hypothetical protein E7372_02545 [Clostridiales bacterium]|nr:hypothetical protein [Clostridiales bacterium]